MRRRDLATVPLALILAAGCTLASPSPTDVPTDGPNDAAATVAPTASPSPTPALTAAPAAEFTVSDLELVGAPDEILAGTELQAVAEVQNTGGAPGTYVAELTVDGDVVTEQRASLDPGTSERLTFDFVAGEPGTYDVAVGDADVTLTVLAPADFEVGTPIVTPNPARTEDKVAVAVEVSNNGGVTGTHRVQLAIDGKVVETQEVTVDGGETSTVEFPARAVAAGRHTVTVNGRKAPLVVWRIERPAHGAIFANSLRGGNGRLAIENGTDSDAVVTLTGTGTPRRPLMVVYVRSNSKYTVTGIRDGTYLVYYRLGARWDAHTRRFTAVTDSGRFRDEFPYRTTATTFPGWRIGLEPVAGGNAQTDEVDDSEFPELDEEGRGD